ncbi:MAG TPA: methyltransferase domain-containing protein [Patescibacteria group bacterium]|nr:methyltransferase domain-containing protein [Patescibacteria group bacterium]
MDSPFRIEEQRDMLAKGHQYKKFRRTYDYAVGIEDLNSIYFWEQLTSKNMRMLSSSQIYKNKIRIVVNCVQNMHGKLLDIGFGHGGVEEKLKMNPNLDLFGIEISKMLVDKIRKSVDGTFKVGNIYGLPFRSNYFDFVLALDVLEHLSTDKTFKAYQEMFRVLKKHALLVASVPLNEDLEEMLRNGKNPNGHLRTYTPDIIKMEMRLSGFKVLYVKYLYAFSRFYFLKSLIVNLFPYKIKKPNLMIIFAEKV